MKSYLTKHFFIVFSYPTLGDCMLLLSGIATSMDSFCLGIFLKQNHTKLTFKNTLILWFGLFFLLLFFHILFKITSISLVNPYLKSILFFLLAIYSLKEDANKSYSKKLSIKDLLLIVLSNSFDSFLVSLTFIPIYSILFVCFVFSFLSILFFHFGFCFPIPLKKENYLTAILFFLLSIIAFF